MSPRRAFGGRRRKFQFGGLTSSSGTGSASSSTQNQTTQIDPGGPYTALMHGVMQKGMDMLNQQYQPYDPSQRFAGFNQDQQNAFQGVRNAQGNWQPYTNAAAGAFNNATTGAAGVGTAGAGAFGTAAASPGGFNASMPWLNQASQSWTDPGVASSWMNPFTQQVSNQTAQTAMQNFMAPGGAWQGVSDAFTGGGAAQFGRERMGDVSGNLLRNFGQGVGNAVGQLNMQGYGQGMQGFQNQQGLYGQLGATAGNLANSTMGAFTQLGQAQTGAAAQGVASNVAAGTAQQGLGAAVQGQNYRDISALQNVGNQQQQQDQKLADFNYQQNREAIQFPMQWMQGLQGLGQGWTLPTSTTNQSYSNTYGAPTSGSPLGNILGAGLAGVGIYQGLSGGSGSGTPNTAAGSGTTYAFGGPVRRRMAAGGYAPIVQSLRSTAQSRQPAQMKRLQAFAQGQQGGAGPGPMGAPPRAFARGGGVRADATQDKALVRKGVRQHERAMHKGKRPTRLAFAGGGEVDRRLLEEADLGDSAFLSSHLPSDGSWMYGMPGGPRSMAREPERPSWGRRAFDTAAEMVRDVPAAFGRSYDRMREDPVGWATRGIQPYLPTSQYADFSNAVRQMADRPIPRSWSEGMLDTGGDLLEAGLAFPGALPGKRSIARAFGR